MNLIREQLGFENTYVRELIRIFENQVEDHSKIDNSVNNQKSKISKSNFSKAWKENIDNIHPTPKLFLPSLHQQNFLSFPVKLPLFFQYAKVSDKFVRFVQLWGFWCRKNYVWY